MSIVIAIITIAASGVFAAVIAYRLSATKDHVFFMRRKVEELYLSLERYDRSLSSYFVSYYALLRNEISYNDLLDLQVKRGGETSHSGDSLDSTTMLVNVYFPELKSHLDAYTSARKAIHDVLAEHKRAYKEGDTDCTRWFKPFHKALGELESVAATFKQAILGEAAALAPAARLWPQSLTVSALREKLR